MNDKVSAPSYIALRDPYAGTWELDDTDVKEDIRPPTSKSTTSSKRMVSAPSTAGAIAVFKPIADRFWWVPWLVIGIIGYRWIKEKF